jgi:hypothetical protein
LYRLDWGLNPQSAALKASTLTITPQMWFIINDILTYMDI